MRSHRGRWERGKLGMLKIKEILWLKYEAGLSARKIARAMNVSHTAVNEYIKRYESSGIVYGGGLRHGDRI